MKLAPRTVSGCFLLLLGFMLVGTHPDFRGGESLHLAYALHVNGSYLLAYSLLIASGVGLLWRLLAGRFFAASPPPRSTKAKS